MVVPDDSVEASAMRPQPEAAQRAVEEGGGAAQPREATVVSLSLTSFACYGGDWLPFYFFF